MVRKVFQPHYEVYITYENESAALDEGMPELDECVKLPAGGRIHAGDLEALKAAKAMADAKTVGADGRLVFKEYVVYVTFKRAFGESDLLATVRRSYDFDTDSDFTWGSPHCGRIPYAEVDAVIPHRFTKV